MAGAPGTGDAPDGDGAEGPDGHSGDAGMPAAVVEMTGDLHEYGLSLGVDLDLEQEEDFAWAVSEAFNAPLPSSWTEYMDDTGRAYYIKDGSSESTWEHPADGVHRELLAFVKEVRRRTPAANPAEREEFVRQHLKEVHERAKVELERAGWSGPYASEQGDYYYSDKLKISSWDCPTAEWEKELAQRHAVLARYLMPEQAGGAVDASAFGEAGAGFANSHHMLQALRLQLGNLQQTHGQAGEGIVPEPSTSRSYHTARSHCSSRSGRSHKDRKERKSGRTREERRAQREAAASGTASAAVSVPEESTLPPYSEDVTGVPYG